MQSPLQLDTYLIDELSVAVNLEYRSGDEMVADISLFPKHLVNSEESRLHQLVLTVTFGAPDTSPDSYPYTGKIVGRGVFSIDDEKLPEDERTHLVLINGTAILLGLLRGHVAQTTALGLHGPLVLPALNIVQAWQDAQESSAHQPEAEAEPVASE